MKFLIMLRTSSRLLVFTSLLIHCTSSIKAGPAQVTNGIIREIKYESGAIWVEDRFHLPIGTFLSRPPMRPILERTQAGDSNLVPVVRELLRDDDLDVVRCSADIRDGFLRLQVDSKVRTSLTKPAKVRLAPDFLAYPTPYSVVSQKFLLPPALIYSGSGAHLLWMPDLPIPAGPDESLRLFLNQNYGFFEFLKPGSGEPEVPALCLKCILKDVDESETLFEWYPTAAPPNAPNREFLVQLDQAHRISGNDLLKIFTNLKVIKSGYYSIDVGGFTNAPPFRTP